MKPSELTIVANPFVGKGMAYLSDQIPFPSTDISKHPALLSQCPTFEQTPLYSNKNLAELCKVSELTIKDERGRFGLGSFKALGAAYVIANDASTASQTPDAESLKGTTYVAASAGNHGLSVAAGAAVFGAKAVIYLSNSVPESFAERLRAKKATVVRHGNTYEESMNEALNAAQTNQWTLLSDSSWSGYFDIPHCLMEGYLQIMTEVNEQMSTPPTHIFLQAGVGGFAGAMAAYARKIWGSTPKVIVVEPDAAPALFNSIKAGEPVVSSGPVSSMGRLDCKEPSLIGLKGLARDADFFVTVSDETVEAFLPLLAEDNFATSPSGGAGVAALFCADKARHALEVARQSRVLCFLTEETA